MARLHSDRYLSPVPSVREAARVVYDHTRALPLVCPHGHVPPGLLADDAPFSEPTSLLITPDHYLLRMLHSQGISLEMLGLGGSEADPREIWQLFADRYDLFLGTPSRAWLEYEFVEILGVDTPLTGDTAGEVYDLISRRLREPDFRPRALFKRFGIEVLTTTDAATDDLSDHARLQEDGFRVLPCFRPDALFAIAAPGWPRQLELLAGKTGSELRTFPAFLQALEERRAHFAAHGATATDHGVEVPLTHRLSDTEAAQIFQRALRGEASSVDESRFQAHMLVEMARMSCDDGLVMQLHAGSLRNHNRALFDRFGPDIGADIPVAAEFTRNLRELLIAYGNHPRFRLVLFTLDESTYTRELAPLAGHYPAVRLGPPWWFLDSIEGMARYRRAVTETAGIFNTAGFNDDTRAFLSIPARHDLARRMDANYLGELVARHELTLEQALGLGEQLAVGLARDTYRL